jgi:formylglycine-generating enzyme required for sulfatase activity
MAWGLLIACAGREFEARAKHDATGGGGGSGETSTGGNSGGSSGDTSKGETRCGILRNVPSNYTMELCVPAGKFTMGSDSVDLSTSGYAAHTPAHEVTLSQFAIEAYEVTVGRYRACILAGACTSPVLDTTIGCTYGAKPGTTENLPISCVTAGQAASFCQWDEGRRLPTEAEWERAAAGTENNVYPWGATFDCSKAAIGAIDTCKAEYVGPIAVGSLAAGKSAIGAFDMAGNVAEWVKDISGAYQDEPVTDPQGPETGTLRIVRGGSYRSPITDGQTFVRATRAGATTGTIGFRCARSIKD